MDLPNNTETNPRERVKAITLRSRKELEGPSKSMLNKQKKVEDEATLVKAPLDYGLVLLGWNY